MRLVLFFLVVLYSSVSVAQTHDKVSLNSGFTQMVFYKLSDGTKTISSNTDWQMAFSCRSAAFNSKAIQAASIRINGAFGTKLYLVSGKNKSNFSSITDTAGLKLRPLVNQDSMWWDGAFNATRVPGDIFDYGWGQYSMSTHLVAGDSLYIMQLPDGSFKKIVIDYIGRDTAYFWYHANLNNTALTNVVINKKANSTKNFIYYDIQNNIIRDKEPIKTNWDLVFFQYQHPVKKMRNAIENTGVLVNDGVGVYKSATHDLSSCYGLTYSYATNGIGQIWRSYSIGIDLAGRTGKYATNNYYIKDMSGQNYLLTFDDYYLSNTGEISFTYEKCWAAGIEESNSPSVAVTFYPNPANDKLTISPAESETVQSVSIFNIVGQKIATYTEQTEIPVHELTEGVYILSVSTSLRNSTAKFVVKR